MSLKEEIKYKKTNNPKYKAKNLIVDLSLNINTALYDRIEENDLASTIRKYVK